MWTCKHRLSYGSAEPAVKEFSDRLNRAGLGFHTYKVITLYPGGILQGNANRAIPSVVVWL